MAGDKEAFGALYQSTLPYMERVVGRYIDDPATAEDVLHDGYLVAFTSISGLREPEKVTSWLSTIFRNLALKELEETTRRASAIEIENIPDLVEDNTAGPIPSLNYIDSLISQLPDGYGKVFRLAVLEGLSHQEIGLLLGIAPHSSSSQLSHAKSMLRRMLRSRRMDYAMTLLVAISILTAWLNHTHEQNGKESESIIATNTSIEEISDEETATNDANQIKEDDEEIPCGTVKFPNKLQKCNPDQNLTENESITNPESNDTIVSTDESVDEDITNESTRQTHPEKQTISPENIRRIRAKEASGLWSMSLAYSGNMDDKANSGFRREYLYGDPNSNDPFVPVEEDVDVTAIHRQPLTFELTAERSISSRFALISGLRYTYLRTDFRISSPTLSGNATQRLHYLGVPFKAKWSFINNDRLSLYLQGGGAVDIPLRGYRDMNLTDKTNSIEYEPHSNVHTPMQWSVEGGIGIQYQIIPALSIYAEPSLQYYFHPGGDIRTIRTDRPLEFAIPIGLRLTW